MSLNGTGLTYGRHNATDAAFCIPAAWAILDDCVRSSHWAPEDRQQDLRAKALRVDPCLWDGRVGHLLQRDLRPVLSCCHIHDI